MDKFKKIFKDTTGSKKLINLIASLVVGIVLLIFSSSFFPTKKTEQKNILSTENTSSQKITNLNSYEEILEKKLENTLSLIEGAGKVSVMLTLSYSDEIIISQDTIVEEEISKESDNEGGNRETSSKKIETQNILITQNGEQKPLILKKIEPKIEGIIIVAEGGNAAEIKSALSKSAQTVLAVEPHKIQVFKMK